MLQASLTCLSSFIYTNLGNAPPLPAFVLEVGQPLALVIAEAAAKAAACSRPHEAGGDA